jgi:hypothetical protein
MRNPSGAEDIGSEEVGVDVGGDIVAVGTAGVKPGVVFPVGIGTGTICPQPRNNISTRNIVNMSKVRLVEFISKIILTSRNKYNCRIS